MNARPFLKLALPHLVLILIDQYVFIIFQLGSMRLLKYRCMGVDVFHVGIWLI